MRGARIIMMTMIITVTMFRLADQQISPSYNGHRVTIKVNRSNEAIAHNYNNQVVLVTNI